MSASPESEAYHPALLQVMRDTESLPAHMQAQIANKYLNNLRYCVTGPIPDGFHGPELMPHMLPEGVTPSPPGPWPVKLVPCVKPTQAKLVNSTINVDTRYAIVPKRTSAVVIDLKDANVTSMVLPKQPFEVIQKNMTVTCQNEPVRLSTNLAFTKLYIRRAKYATDKPTRIYLAIERDHVFTWLPGNDGTVFHTRYEFIYRSWRMCLPASVKDSLEYLHSGALYSKKKKARKRRIKKDKRRDQQIRDWINANDLDKSSSNCKVDGIRNLGAISVGQLQIGPEIELSCDLHLLLLE